MSILTTNSRNSEPPVLSIAALTVPLLCAAVMLFLRNSSAAFLAGCFSFFLAAPSLLLGLVSLIIGEKPRWIAGLAFAANCLLIYSLTFIDLH